jgi:EpsI family protein
VNPTDTSDNARADVFLGLVFAAVLAAFWPSLVSLPGTWNGYSGHGYFVAALTVWLVWRDRHVFVGEDVPAFEGLRPVLAVLSLGWMSAVVMDVAVAHEGLFTAILTVWALATFGPQARRSVLAIGLTFTLALPIWGSFVPALQRATTVMSGTAARMVGISAEIGYDFVSLTSGTFLVESGCAGLNFLMGGLVLGAFYAHIFVREWRTQLKIVALAGVVSIMGNWVRVTVLIVIGEATQMQSELLGNHLWQGWVIFSLLMIPTYFLARRIEARDQATRPADSTTQPRSDATDVDAAPARGGDATVGRSSYRGRAVTMGMLACVGPVLYMAIGAIPRSGDLDRNLSTLELSTEWTAEEVVPTEDGWRPDFQGVDDRAEWMLSGGPEQVRVTRHYFIDQRQGEELVQYNNQIAPDSLTVSERLVGPPGTSRRIVTEAVILTDAQPRVVWYWYRVGGIDTPFSSKAKLLEIIAFVKRSPASELVTVSAECRGEDCTAAADAVRSVLGGASVPEVVLLPPGAEAISFLGDTLVAPAQSDAVRSIYLEKYAEAEDALVASPEGADALLWMGRRTAYLGQYRAAIDIYTHALTLHPDDARLYRHRGHRHLTVREPNRAIADFERGLQLTAGQPDQVEPDGLPNRLNTPTSTLQFNLWYHLALAHYVQGDFDQALAAQRSCLAVSVHPDSVVAASYWLFMTLSRLGQVEEAAAVLDGISADMEVIEATGYLDLLLLFKGERTLDDIVGPSGSEATLESTTTAYGLGVWHLLNERPDAAREIWTQMLTGRDQWSAFGYMAAEGELARQ